MSVNKTSKRHTGRTLPIPALIVAVIALVAFLGWQSYVYFAPHEPVAEAKPLLPEYKAANDWVAQKAKESQGDVTKLSPEDQKQLAEKTHGMGATVLKSMYEQSNH